MGHLVGDLTKMVERFATEVLGLPIPHVPSRLTPQRKQWARSAIQEELQEFLDANTLEDEADALIDLSYFALGRLVEMGLAPRACFEEVHEANMKKERGFLSKRPDSLGYDAIKPEGWKAPDLAPFLTATRADLLAIYSDKVATHPAYRDTGFSVEEVTSPNPKVLVIGHARHGKDTVCEILREEYGLQFTSSSMFCAERVVMPYLAKIGIGYNTVEECYEDRVNHRSKWFDAIAAYCAEDPARLGQEIFEVNDVYAGVRSKKEFHALKNAGAYSFCIWVDRSDHLLLEQPNSMQLEPWMADFVVDNNGDLSELRREVCRVMDAHLEWDEQVNQTILEALA